MKHLILTSNIALLPPLLLLIIIFLLFKINAFTGTLPEGQGFVSQLCSSDSNSNYTSGSQYESNLINNLLPLLVANGSRTGFLTTSFGAAPPDIVYGLVQCRGDISLQDCQTCLNTSRVEIVTNCPNGLAATRINDYCWLRYNNFSFFSKKVDDYHVAIAKPVNVTEPVSFNKQLGDLMKNLTSTAVSEPSRFETGSMVYNDFNNIYGLVQCTQDLSTTSCSACLQTMLNEIPTCCSGKQGGRVYGRSCYVRFEIYKFFGLFLPPPPRPSLRPSPPSTHGKSTTKSSSSPNVVVIVVPIIIGSLLLISVALYVYLAKRKKRRRRRRRETTEAASITAGKDIKTEDSLQFDLVTLVNATNNFSDTNKLGQGGFATVYKGELQDGEEIAVKRLTNHSVQGPQQFKNEVALLHKLQHRNLVKLLGYCLEGAETILIYELVPNSSLDKYLFDPSKRVYLDWGKRYKIIRGIARGLLYLHEDSRLRIIHRDLKAGNILLDGEMNPRIADFGTAKLFEVDQTTGNTSKIAGTFGYMAPEYVLHGLFSVKSDVFSFGVLLLEIVCGQNINSFQQATPPADLLSYAWKHWSEGTSIELIDPTLKDNCSINEVTRSIHVGLLCVQVGIEDRPTMSFVVNMLDNSIPLASPAQPRLFTFRRTGSNAVKREVESDDPSTNSSISLSSKGLSLDETNLRQLEGSVL